MFFVCAAILFQSPLLFLTCVVATQALFVAMVGGWAECLEVGNPEPTDEAPALTLVNHLWWQLLSPYLKTAGNVISTYYAEDPEVYFKKQRNDRHLDFHELGYPQNWGTASPAFAMALVCPQLRYLSHDVRHRVLEVWLWRATTSQCWLESKTFVESLTQTICKLIHTGWFLQLPTGLKTLESLEELLKIREAFVDRLRSSRLAPGIQGIEDLLTCHLSTVTVNQLALTSRPWSRRYQEEVTTTGSTSDPWTSNPDPSDPWTTTNGSTWEPWHQEKVTTMGSTSNRWTSRGGRTDVEPMDFGSTWSPWQ